MSKRGPTREELQRMKYKDLQKLAKAQPRAPTHTPGSPSHPQGHNIRANTTSEAIIKALLDELVENQPEPKTADSSLGSSSNPSPARAPDRKPKGVPAKPIAGKGTGKSKLVAAAGGSSSRKPAGTRTMIIPPGVVAANPDPKGKGKVKKPGFSGPPRAAVGSKLPIAKTSSMDSVRTEIAKTASMESVRTEIGDHDTDIAMNFSDLSPPLRNASHSDSISLASLTSRIRKLEHAREVSRERREKEMEMLRNQLKAAQESISVLAKKNDALKAQVDSAPPSATPKDVSDVLSRVIILEDLFRKMKVGKSSSETSDDIPYADDLGLVGAPLRSDYQTPPNRPEPHRRRSNVLAPAALILHSTGIVPPSTPPPHLSRYTANPDESPSPTRLPTNASRIFARPSVDAVPTASSSTPSHGKRRASELLEGRGTMGPPERGRFSRTMESERELDNESDDPDRPPLTGARAGSGSCDEDGGEEKGAPLGALPHPLYPGLATGASSLPAGDASSSRPQRRSRASRGNVRSQPYVKRDVPRGYSSSPGADNEYHEEPQDHRGIFGATPGSSRIPPNPFAGGPLPVLNFGRASLTHSIVETPATSPSRALALPTEETPPASRTRFGTEFGTSMKNRFSD